MDPVFYTDEGEGLPIIFIHGFCETHELWSDFISSFTKTNRVITFDLPGFGQSPLPSGELTIDSIGLIIIKWLKNIGIVKAIFVGHSLGGYVALSIANQDPGTVAGLCLFHSTAGVDNEEKRSGRDRVNDFVRKHGVAPYTKTYVPGLFFQKHHPAISGIYEMSLKTDPKTLILYSNSMKIRSDRTAVLKTADYPIMIIAGLNDKLIPVNDLMKQVTFSSNSELILLKHSAHMGMIEEGQIAGKAILKFVLKCNSAI
jgi:pimeloyl-ACP methyl ester carboxylesterase